MTKVFSNSPATNIHPSVAPGQVLGLPVLLLQVLFPVVLDDLVNVGNVAGSDVPRAVRLKSPAS